MELLIAFLLVLLILVILFRQEIRQLIDIAIVVTVIAVFGSWVWSLIQPHMYIIAKIVTALAFTVVVLRVWDFLKKRKQIKGVEGPRKED